MPRFSLIRLFPYKVEDVRNESEEENCSISNGKEMLAAALNVGEHFAVIAMEDNIEGDEFWMLICEEALAMVEEVNKVDY